MLTPGCLDLLVRMKKEGHMSSYIGFLLRVTKRRVNQIWAGYRKGGTLPPLNPGRKRIYSEEEKKAVGQMYLKYRVRAVRLGKLMETRHNMAIPHNRIHTYLKELGHSVEQESKKNRRKWVRYERDYSMSLWHTDWCEIRFPGNKLRKLIVFQDDASRFLLAYGLFDEATTKNTLKVLKRAIKRHGKPESILTDHGTQFFNNQDPQLKETGFQAFLKKNGIRHILGRVNHPQTNGKVERLFYTITRILPEFEYNMPKVVKWYNDIRPHMSLGDGLETPKEAFIRKRSPAAKLGAASQIFEVK